MGRLDGRVALVTGASRGLGAAVALRFAAEGATVIAVAELPEELDALAAEAAAAGAGDGGELWTRVADLADPAAVDALADSIVSRHDRLHVLVHAAAVLRNRPFRELTAQEFEA